MLKHILWDNDGTLVDSEILAMPVGTKTISNHMKLLGVQVDEDALMKMAGKTFIQMCEIIEQQHNVTLPKEKLYQQQKQTTINVLSTQLEPTKGTEDLLNWIKANGLESTIVTSSALDRVVPGLKKVGFDKYFPQDRVLSAIDTLPSPMPKPAPDIYLHAVDFLGTRKEECLAIEDSTSGVGAAVAAGINVVGYVGGSHIKAEDKQEKIAALKAAGAMTVIEDMAEMKKIITAMQNPTPESVLNYIQRQHKQND